MMKKNQLVKIRETGQIGRIYELNEMTGAPISIKDINTGEIIQVLDKTIVLVRLLKWLYLQIKSLF